MFRETSRRFRISYYLSCLIVPVSLLIIFIIISGAEKVDLKIIALFQNFLSIKKISFYSLMILLIVCFCSLCYVKRVIKNRLKYSNSQSSPQKFKIENTFNPGFRDFLLSCLLPLMSTFSFDDSPLASITMFYSMLIIMFFFYKNSSDFFPNLPLSIAGYTLFIAKEVDNIELDDQRTAYVFGKTKNISKNVSSVEDIIYLEKSSDKTKKIGIIKEKC